MIGTTVTRRASCILLYLSLSPFFVSPQVIVLALAAICDISVRRVPFFTFIFITVIFKYCLYLYSLLYVYIQGPVIGSVIYISTYHLDLPYPMDSSFFLAAGACVCALLYLCSLLVSVQFRGDFGVVADETPSRANIISSLNIGRAKPITAYTALQRRVGSMNNLRNASGVPSEGTHTQPYAYIAAHTPLTTPRGSVYPGYGESISGCSCQDLLEIPRGDLRLLLSSPVAGYGTKLHNLKLGMKDS